MQENGGSLPDTLIQAAQDIEYGRIKIMTSAQNRIQIPLTHEIGIFATFKKLLLIECFIKKPLHCGYLKVGLHRTIQHTYHILP